MFCSVIALVVENLSDSIIMKEHLTKKVKVSVPVKHLGSRHDSNTINDMLRERTFVGTNTEKRAYMVSHVTGRQST